MHHELTAEDLRFLPPDLPESELLGFVDKAWGITGTLKPLAGERDQNFRLTTDEGERYVLKVGGPLEDLSLVDYQVRALLRIEDFDPAIPVPRLIRSTEGKPVERMIDHDGKPHTVRLLSYVPGVPIREFVPPPLAACHAVGTVQGRICDAFRDFSHPAQDHFMPWDMMNGLVESPALRKGYLPEDLQNVCERHLDRLGEASLPRMHELPSQVIHNDAHTGNVMCNPDDPSEITGVIDFGDLACRPILTDLATSLTSFMGHADDPIAAAQQLVRGFNSVYPIPDEQLELMYDAVLTRSIMTVQLLNFRAMHTHSAPSLLTIDVPDAIENLRVVLAIDAQEFLQSVTL